MRNFSLTYNKVAIIPIAHENDKNIELQSYLEIVGFDVNYQIGKKSLFDAYYSGTTDINDNDLVIMCHNDIKILSEPHFVKSIIQRTVPIDNVGFIGVAGTRYLDNSGKWWNDQKSLLGSIFHGKDIENSKFKCFGPLFGCAVVLDGLFLAIKGETLKKIDLRKPRAFYGDWHYYDIYYTFQAHRLGFNNLVVPLQILHRSTGHFDKSWYKSRKAFQKKFKNFLPATASNNIMELP